MCGKVYLIGAGPGDPELLTRKAWKLICDAEVVLHDALVSPEIVRLAPARAIICDVGKRCGLKSITQEQLHALLIEHARRGRRVVRLQGGDPLIFGRAGEEMAALREADIEFEIVPGVTAASAAAAAAQITLTNRRVASKLIFLSGHSRSGEEEADWGSLPGDATFVVYMPGGKYGEIARKLRGAGVPDDTPCLIVSQASISRQKILRMDMSELEGVAAHRSPAVLIIGEVTRAQARELAAASLAGEAART
jgi:uroporphyrin-III C-methyltransferase